MKSVCPLVSEAYLKLVQFDVYLARRKFSALHNKVRNCPSGRTLGSADDIGRVCHAVDVACIWYFKQVLCLQRSAVTCCLLRRYGVPAELVIGIRKLPFQAHAWVEVNRQVVNDKTHMPELFTILDRC